MPDPEWAPTCNHLPSTDFGKKHQGTSKTRSLKQHCREAHSSGLIPGNPQFLRSDTSMTHCSSAAHGRERHARLCQAGCSLRATGPGFPETLEKLLGLVSLRTIIARGWLSFPQEDAKVGKSSQVGTSAEPAPQKKNMSPFPDSVFSSVNCEQPTEPSPEGGLRTLIPKGPLPIATHLPAFPLKCTEHWGEIPPRECVLTAKAVPVAGTHTASLVHTVFSVAWLGTHSKKSCQKPQRPS